MWVGPAQKAACDRYAELYPEIDSAAFRAHQALDRALSQAGLKVSTEVRAKSKAGYFRKVSNLPEGSDFWADVSDKIGCRIIIESNSDIPGVVSALEIGGFAVLSHDDQRLTRDPRKLKYAGYHMQVEHPLVALNDGAPVEMEIQVRSRTLHAWSETEHRLVYKSAVNLDPTTLRRLERLLVLVELFDEELDRGILEVESMREYAVGRFLRELETRFVKVVDLPGDDEISFEVLGILLADTSSEVLEMILTELDDFIAAESIHIDSYMSSLGPNAATFDPTRFWLLSQPESLLVLFWSSHKPALLTARVQGSDIEDDITEIRNSWS